MAKDTTGFRAKLMQAVDWVLDMRLRRTAGVPRGGEGWSQERTICKDRALFKGIAVANKGGAGLWLFICDSPGPQTKSTCCPIYIPGPGMYSLDWTAAPRLMSQGIWVGVSTDPILLTAPNTADVWFEVAYEPVR